MSTTHSQILEFKAKKKPLEEKNEELESQKNEARKPLSKLMDNEAYKVRSKYQRRRSWLIFGAILAWIAGIIFIQKTILLLVICGIVGVGLIILSQSKNKKIKEISAELAEIDLEIQKIRSAISKLDEEIRNNNRQIKDIDKELETLYAKKKMEDYLDLYKKGHIFIHAAEYGDLGKSPLRQNRLYIDDHDYGYVNLPFAKYELSPGPHIVKIKYSYGDYVYTSQAVQVNVDNCSKLIAYKFTYKMVGNHKLKIDEFDDVIAGFIDIGVKSSDL